MSLILSGTNGLSDVDGSAATPAIRGTDTNTGMFFPAADTIAFAEGGTEAMRLDASGNLGLGTTSPAYKLNIIEAKTLTPTTGDGQIAIDNSTAGQVSAVLFSSQGTRRSQISSGLGGSGNDGYLAFTTRNDSTGFGERMRLDASGNLGIGTTSPAYRLDVRDTNATVFSRGTAGYGAFYAQGSGTNSSYIFMGNATSGEQGRITCADTGILTFSNGSGATERARIDSSGNLLVGRTTVPTFTDTTGFGFAYDRPNKTTFFVTDQSTSIACTYFNATSYTSGTGYFAQFRVNGSTVGNITTNGSTTTYATSSDYRLKENITPMTGALATVAQLKPCTYTWKIDGSEGQGFIAHELQEVLPDAVVGEKDAVDEDGNIKPQGIDTSFLVATLTAAIQEQQQIITQLQADVNSLKAQ